MENGRKTKYPFGYGREELKRLGEQYGVWEQDHRRLLDRAGFCKGQTIVDLGCGPGFTTLALARIAGPEGRVIAVDMDGDKSIPLLEERATAAGLSNIETKVADLADFDLPEGSVDGVFGRWVLMYIPEKEAKALTVRMVKWLSPGGAWALTEFCNYRHIHIYPPSLNLPAIAEGLIRAVRGDRGCNPEVGNVLPKWLISAGLDIEISVNIKAVRATTPEWIWPDGVFRDHVPSLVDKGYLAQDDVDAFLTEWEEQSQNPAAVFFGSPMMEVIGRRQ